MRAMLVNEKTQTFVCSEVEKPVPKSGEVLIHVEAAGVNRADVMQRHGEYPSPKGCPPWPGLEVAGRICAMGKLAQEKSSFAAGDAVCALLGGGGYSEYVSVPYGMVMHAPAGCSMETAAAIPETYATAYLNLFREGKLKAGETLFVAAGASGVGIAATQIAKAFGARVIVSVRSDEKAESIRKFGADRIVNSKKEALLSVFRSEPVNMVLDCVGGAEMGACFGEMARYGRWIQIATLGGAETQLNLKTLYGKRLRLIGSTLRSRTPAQKAAVLAALEKDILPLVASGKIQPEIYSVLPIEQAMDAHRILEENKNIGKVILHGWAEA